MSGPQRLLGAVITVAALLGFVALYGLPAVAIIRSKSVPATFTAVNIVAVATIFAGLVGGIVAAFFGLKPSPTAPAPSSYFASGVRRLGATVAPAPTTSTVMQEAIGYTYVVIYLVTVALVFVALLVLPTGFPDHMSAMLLYAVGTFVAVARAFVSP